MAMLRILLPALVLIAACEKKTKKAPVNDPNNITNNKSNASTPQPKKQAPKGVPAKLESLIQSYWPVIEAEGEKFSAKFAEAQKLRSNRAALTKKIDEAQVHYVKLRDEWAKIAYWAADELDDGRIDQKTHDLCERYLRAKSAKITSWTKKAKSLKELSAVK